MENNHMWNQLSVQVLYKAFCPVYGWMFLDFINGDSRYYTAHSPALLNLIFGSQITFYAFCLRRSYWL